MRKIGQSSHKKYSNNILNFQESTTILNACTKKSGNLLKEPRSKEIQTQTEGFLKIVYYKTTMTTKKNITKKLDSPVHC